MLPSSRIVTDQHGSIELPKLPCWPPGAPRTSTVVPGPTTTNTELHGSHAGSCRI
ncbi:hypothetical protein DPMN_111786 [Dreissena polymorpha]|uniref:Uncharacterized protein n=1 Tax=Dreissena polymorpha TaxID=45954 RepID=A0A9D4KFL4_DREPO|nr:hypothetical protein DPMN_111786 [Dreissena polymorpha]